MSYLTIWSGGLEEPLYFPSDSIDEALECAADCASIMASCDIVDVISLESGFYDLVVRYQKEVMV